MTPLPSMIDDLRSCAAWSGFAAEMVGILDRGGRLSERQSAACRSMIDKVAARRAAERAAPAVDLGRVHAMFEAAMANGLKAPRFYAAGLVLSLAKARSANAGAVYVKRGGEYLGKVQGRAFKPVCDPTTAAGIAGLLAEIAQDPMEAAKRHGRSTGVCCCCGRTLTDPDSVAAGIGPICAEKWFGA